MAAEFLGDWQGIVGALLGGGGAAGVGKLYLARLAKKADDADRRAEAAEAKADEALKEVELLARMGPFVTTQQHAGCSQGQTTAMQRVEKLLADGFLKLEGLIQAQRIEFQGAINRVNQRVDDIHRPAGGGS